MKNLEPKIYRQRLIIEGKQSIEITADVIKEYLRAKPAVICVRFGNGQGLQ